MDSGMAESQTGDPALSAGDLKLMLGQCLKLASENKITAKNTWGLPLIEHLDDLIKAEPDTTNFQRASVTLDAGVKIYGTRVDSVHTETFKILGGLGRAAVQEDGTEDGDPALGDVGDGQTVRRRKALNLDPNSTLEASLEALNVKKFDLAFDVDPLFQQTSAQFDEGGAQGLLLNNFGVYRGCEVMFDSCDVPEKALAESPEPEVLEVGTDLAGLEAPLAAWNEACASAAHGDLGATLCPSLAGILALAGSTAVNPEVAAAEAAALVERVASGTAAAGPEPGCNATLSSSGQSVEQDVVYHDDGDTEQTYNDHFDMDYGGSGGDYDSDVASEDGGSRATAGPSMADSGLTQDALRWLMAGGSEAVGEGPALGLPSAAGKGWAGAAHWRYKAAPSVSAGAGAEAGEEVDRAAGGKKPKKTAAGRTEPLDFVSLMAAVPPPTFDMLPLQKKAVRRGKRAEPKRKLLPEDYHYKAETLFHYALRPRNTILSGAVLGAEPGGEGGDWGALGADGSTLELVQAARQVDKVEINYARAAKHVDVRALKEIMWSGMQSQVAAGRGASSSSPLQLQALLSGVPPQSEAGAAADVSVHLCFICVLHLANEHGLVVRGVPSLDHLLVHGDVPAST